MLLDGRLDSGLPENANHNKCGALLYTGCRAVHQDGVQGMPSNCFRIHLLLDKLETIRLNEEVQVHEDLYPLPVLAIGLNLWQE